MVAARAWRQAPEASTRRRVVTFHPPKRPCAHRIYYVSCEDFDLLVTRAAASCELCGITGPETKNGTLCIDHEPFVGQWAVRGLLCNRCNSSLGRRLVPEPGTDRYLAQPWWRELLIRHGVTSMNPAEPPLGVEVRGPGTQRWVRTSAGWERTCGLGPTLTWANMQRTYGPHNIAVA